MKKNKKPIKAIVLITSGFLAAIILLALFDLSNFESTHIDRNSAAYHISAPRYLKAVDLINECKKPQYRWKGRDGESAPFSSLSYASFATSTDIFQHYENAFRKQSCEPRDIAQAPESRQPFSMNCKNSDFLSIDIFVSGVGRCRDVTIDFIENH